SVRRLERAPPNFTVAEAAAKAYWQSTSIWHLQPQQRRVLLPAINVAVLLGARALGAGEAHFDCQGSVVIDDDDVGRVAAVEARNGSAIDDFGVAGAAVGLCIVEHDVYGQPERAGVL